MKSRSMPVVGRLMEMVRHCFSSLYAAWRQALIAASISASMAASSSVNPRSTSYGGTSVEEVVVEETVEELGLEEEGSVGGETEALGFLVTGSVAAAFFAGTGGVETLLPKLCLWLPPS